MSEVKRAAIYVRVSTVEQDTDLQETELRQYAESRGWKYIVYRDKGQSGAKNDRPALNQMLSDLRRRKFDVIVVWKLESTGEIIATTAEHRGGMPNSGCGFGFPETKYRHDLASGKTDISDSGCGGGVRTGVTAGPSKGGNGAGT